ncbi:Calcium-regulated actin-bundling protein C-terminal domain-containing protein [Entamoeba marina]
MADFKEVTARDYKQQATFFLNAFWAEAGNDAEKIWKQYFLVCELDVENGAEGCKLDEFQAHRFFEKEGIAMSVSEMRQNLNVVDPKFKKIAFIEFLLFKYKQTIVELMKRPQGTNEEMVKAQKAMEAVQSEIKKIEDKKTELEKKAAAGSGVAAMRAGNELQQLLSEDKTDLNRALVTAEAAVRKAQKAGGEGNVAPGLKKYKPQKKGGIAK